MSYDSGGMSEADAAGLYTRGLEQRLERANSELQSATHSRDAERRTARELEVRLSAAQKLIDLVAQRHVRVSFPDYAPLTAEEKRIISGHVAEYAARNLFEFVCQLGDAERRAAILENELYIRLGPMELGSMLDKNELDHFRSAPLRDELVRTQLELRKVQDEFAAYRLRDLRRPAVMA